MNMKKITAIAAAVVIAAGICTGVPTGTGNSPLMAITASANTVSQNPGSAAAKNNLPASYSATGGEGKIDVKWTAVSGATSYYVGASVKQADGTYRLAGSKNVTGTSCTIDNLPADTYLILIKPNNAEYGAGLDGVVVTGSTASANEEFVTETDKDGNKVITKYNGNGEDVVIPNGVVGISKGAFAAADTVTSITFPKSCYKIDESAFEECLNLKTVVFKGDAEINANAFKWCIKLESVTINGSVKTGFYSGSFYGCQSLKKVAIKGNAYDFAIGDAFINCYSLSSINIPSKCTDIHGMAFLNCFNLSKLTVPKNTNVVGDGNLGYVMGYKSKSDADKALSGSDVENTIFVADGKTKCYIGYINGFDYTNNQFDVTNKKFTPKQLTLTVTKGSSAEKWAKANGVKYTYASSSSSSGNTGAPANFKASKTNNSVTLSWDAVDGADLYRVYKYNEKTGKYEKYKDVKSAKCTVSGLSANTKYKFKVVAYDKVDGKYVKGETSKAVSVTTKK